MKMQGALLVSLGLIHSLSSQATTPSGGQCCQRKIVSSPSQYEGTYDFVRVFDGQKDENCFDACIYSKAGAPGEEYCFKAVSSGAASIQEQCDASVSQGLSTGTIFGMS